MLNNILLGYEGTDSSRVALAHSIEIADVAGSWIHLVNVDAADRDGAEELQFDHSGPGAGAVMAAQAGIEAEQYQAPEPGSILADAVEACHNAQVRCTQRHLYGSPGERLAQLGRLSSMVVIGRKSSATGGRRIGATTGSLLRHCSVPLMVCAPTYQRLKSVQALFWDDAASARAVTVAAELCMTMNVPLQIGISEVGARRAEQLVREIDYAMKGFHIEHETRVVSQSAADATALSATETGAHWVVMAYPPTLWPWRPSPLKTALMTQNLVRVFVP